MKRLKTGVDARSIPMGDIEEFTDSAVTGLIASGTTFTTVVPAGATRAFITGTNHYFFSKVPFSLPTVGNPVTTPAMGNLPGVAVTAGETLYFTAIDAVYINIAYYN